jgi:hypothetical protein
MRLVQKLCRSFVLVMSLGAMPALAAPITLTPYTSQFQGIDTAQATLSGSVAYIERSNLTAPGIGFEVTPQYGPLATIAQTTSRFLRSSGAAIAINASFFAPCCNAAAEPKSIIGLSISGSEEQANGKPM